MSKLPLIVYSTLAALLMALAWPFIGSLWPVVFIALVPMLLLEEHVFRKGYRPRKVFLHAYWFFLVFNCATTWWIWYASAGGAVMAFFFNALLMAIPFWLFHVTRRRVGSREGMIAFFLNWLAFEYLHYSWELSWPWLSFGNVFAMVPSLVQWYEVTGVTGGTLWILVLNFLFFRIVRDVFWLQKQNMKEQVPRFIFIALLLFTPILISLKMYSSCSDKGEPVDIVIVQPNIDPYNEKFGGLTMKAQFDIYADLARKSLDEKVEYLLGPETQIPFSVNEDAIDSNTAVKAFRNLCSDYPQLKIVTGMSSYTVFREGSRQSPTAKPTSEPGYVYDHFNASLQIENNAAVQVYHKMKLVLGVEKVPFSGWFPFLEKLALDMGGSSGSMGSETAPKVFTAQKDPRHVVVPAICYESIYGEHIAEFVRLGGDLIFVITNDGWWEDTPGYKQHMSYSRLRAIENRRSIARCANTGISCFINQRGDVVQQTKWWEPAVLRGVVFANTEQTWFTRHGDFIGRSALFVALLLAFYTFARMLMGKTASKKEI